MFCNYPSISSLFKHLGMYHWPHLAAVIVPMYLYRTWSSNWVRKLPNAIPCRLASSLLSICSCCSGRLMSAFKTLMACSTMLRNGLYGGSFLSSEFEVGLGWPRPWGHSWALWPSCLQRRQRPESGQARGKWPGSWQMEHKSGWPGYHTRHSKPSALTVDWAGTWTDIRTVRVPVQMVGNFLWYTNWTEYSSPKMENWTDHGHRRL